MNKTYSVDYFIEKFSAIPESEWCIIHLSHARTGQRCALGHCGEDYHVFGKTPESSALTALFLTVLGVFPEIINDQDINGLPARCHNHTYNGRTPRARILQALQDIKFRQEQAQPKPAPVQQPCTHLFLVGCCVYCSHVQQPVVPVEVGCD